MAGHIILTSVGPITVKKYLSLEAFVDVLSGRTTKYCLLPRYDHMLQRGDNLDLELEDEDAYGDAPTVEDVETVYKERTGVEISEELLKNLEDIQCLLHYVVKNVTFYSNIEKFVESAFTHHGLEPNFLPTPHYEDFYEKYTEGLSRKKFYSTSVLVLDIIRHE